MTKFIALMLLCVSLLATSTHAAIDDLTFTSLEDEARYHQLIDEMRCPMCLNANLSGSDAPIAADLRAEIFKQIQEGRTNTEIIEFMRARYGDFIMYRPPLNRGTVLLWFGPGALLLAGFFILRRMLAVARAAPATEKLSTEEIKQLNSILDDSKD
jgi:cytochrome c-type biogenesis protein CcmH